MADDLNPTIEDDLPYVPEPVADPEPEPEPESTPQPVAIDERAIALKYAADHPEEFRIPQFDPPKPDDPPPPDTDSWIYDHAKAERRIADAVKQATEATESRILGALAPILKSSGRAEVIAGLPEEARPYVEQIETELGANFYGADPKIQGLARDAAYGRAVREGKLSISLPEGSEPSGGGLSSALSREERQTAQEYFNVTGVRATEAEIKKMHKEAAVV